MTLDTVAYAVIYAAATFALITGALGGARLITKWSEALFGCDADFVFLCALGFEILVIMWFAALSI